MRNDRLSDKILACRILEFLPKTEGHRLPLWVKTGNTRSEHLFSALPPEADIQASVQHDRFVP
jgi:hypothetical protein